VDCCAHRCQDSTRFCSRPRSGGSHRDGQPRRRLNRGVAKPVLRPRRHGHDGTSSTTIPLLTVNYTSAPRLAVALPVHSTPLPISGSDDEQTTGVLVRHGMGGMGGGMMSFLIDGKSLIPHALTSRAASMRSNNGPSRTARAWITRSTCTARSSGDEPHAQRRPTGRTISCLARHRNVAALETVIFKVVQRQLGRRMYHCHILEHEDRA